MHHMLQFDASKRLDVGRTGSGCAGSNMGTHGAHPYKYILDDFPI